MSQTGLTIGTEYLDRKITGTGTEEDPWIIGSIEGDTDENMFQNFLDAVCTSSAYVKLARDIDVSQSKTYREGLGTYITTNAAKIYADESKAAIKNLITKEKLLNIISLSIITNIQFLNCIVNNASGPINSHNSNNSMSYCDFSLLLRGTGADIGHIMGQNISINHCSIDVKIINGLISGSTFNSLKNCQINIDTAVSSAANASNPIFKNCEKCGITGNFMINAASAGIYLLGICSYCYIAGTASATGTNVNLAILDSMNCYLCLETDGKASVSNSNWKITSDQLKSKEYLYKIGFLP